MSKEKAIDKINQAIFLIRPYFEWKSSSQKIYFKMVRGCA